MSLVDKQENGLVVFVIVAALLLLVFIIGSNGGLSDPKAATRVLTEQGYTEIEITGWKPALAGHGETYSTGFKAKSPVGMPVSGAVTSGANKGHTIRFD